MVPRKRYRYSPDLREHIDRWLQDHEGTLWELAGHGPHPLKAATSALSSELGHPVSVKYVAQRVTRLISENRFSALRRDRLGRNGGRTVLAWHRPMFGTAPIRLPPGGLSILEWCRIRAALNRTAPARRDRPPYWPPAMIAGYLAAEGVANVSREAVEALLASR